MREQLIKRGGKVVGYVVCFKLPNGNWAAHSTAGGNDKYLGNFVFWTCAASAVKAAAAGFVKDGTPEFSKKYRDGEFVRVDIMLDGEEIGDITKSDDADGWHILFHDDNLFQTDSDLHGKLAAAKNEVKEIFAKRQR